MNAADGSGRRVLSTPGLQQEAVDMITWSPDGSQLAVTFFTQPGPTQIAVVPLGGAARQNSRLLTSLSGGAIDPSWSPDGAWLAFAGHDGYATEIFVVRPDGTAVTRLTSDGQLARSPAWSPDGKQLAFLTNRTGWFEVWVVDVQADPSSGALTASAPRQATQDMHVDAASGLSWGR
jgi:TolB protein